MESASPEQIQQSERHSPAKPIYEGESLTELRTYLLRLLDCLLKFTLLSDFLRELSKGISYWVESRDVFASGLHDLKCGVRCHHEVV